MTAESEAKPAAELEVVSLYRLGINAVAGIQGMQTETTQMTLETTAEKCRPKKMSDKMPDKMSAWFGLSCAYPFFNPLFNCDIDKCATDKRTADKGLIDNRVLEIDKGVLEIDNRVLDNGPGIENYLKEYIGKKQLPLYIKFAQQYFDTFVISIGDTLLKYSLMAFAGFNEKDATNKALSIGCIVNDIVSEIVNDIEGDAAKNIVSDSAKNTAGDAAGNSAGTFNSAGNMKIKLLRDSDIEKEHFEEYSSSLDKVRCFAAENQKFLSKCRALAYRAAQNKMLVLKNSEPKKCRRAFRLSTSYSIDDIALYFLLYKRYPVSISKYEAASVIKDASSGVYPQLTDFFQIKDVGHIQAVPKGERIFHKPYDDEYEAKIRQKEGKKKAKRRQK